jgi:hypothetical protein
MIFIRLDRFYFDCPQTQTVYPDDAHTFSVEKDFKYIPFYAGKCLYAIFAYSDLVRFWAA